MKLLIKITKSVLEESKLCTITGNIGTNCAIGRAIHNLYPYSYTERRKIYFHENEEGLIRHIEHTSEPLSRVPQFGITRILPKIACDFIYRFDKSSPEERVKMEPISFEIDFPDELVEKIGINEVKEILNNSKTLELV